MSNYAITCNVRDLLEQGKSVDEICTITGQNRSVVKRYARNRRYRKVYAERFPGKSAARKRKYKFGLSESDYARMVNDQNGVCAICGQPEKATYRGRIKQLAVDHCHETGKIRKLLCACCNTVLGTTHDNVWLLRKMISYLEQNSA